MINCPLQTRLALPFQHCNVWSLTNSVSEAMIQISSDIEHVPSASALRARLLSERGGLEKTEKVLSLEGMWFWWAWGKKRQRKYSTSSTDPFYADLGKREKIPTNHHQAVSFQVYLISTTPHPRLDLGGNEKWKGGRCSWQGGESRCALGRRGDHKYQQCLALSFARTM